MSEIEFLNAGNNLLFSKIKTVFPFDNDNKQFIKFIHGKPHEERLIIRWSNIYRWAVSNQFDVTWNSQYKEPEILGKKMKEDIFIPPTENVPIEWINEIRLAYIESNKKDEFKKKISGWLKTLKTAILHKFDFDKLELYSCELSDMYNIYYRYS